MAFPWDDWHSRGTVDIPVEPADKQSIRNEPSQSIGNGPVDTQNEPVDTVQSIPSVDTVQSIPFYPRRSTVSFPALVRTVFHLAL